ncbi:MAG: OmpH family outer membrane protein [Bacteroidales bacterium]|nr:OmpH family outer membrane protein [Bacteroidales bacterium]MDD5787739.1 OmpH family outer membrane protein [Bacteroidales bacterium]MDD6897511.1 OmpH family outer membrane protein [Bacteroidales bacterium]MDY2693575.1 OmpH family outer membrane protein [Prevotella sp.]MDY4731670.1 OmpH family outer membrane protein [Prevotella sp.]
MKKLFLIMMLCAPLTVFAQKFGHVDAQAVMQSLPEFIKARGEIEALSKQYENDMKAMQDEIQRKSDEYDKSKSTMNATQQQEVETNLQQMIQKFQQAYQDNQQALQKAQQEKMQPIMNKIMTAIKNVGKDGGYVYIMDISTGIPYISDTLSKDVTNDVKAEMNKLK